MKTYLRIIFILPCVLLASEVAEGRICSPPPEYPYAKLVRSSEEKAFFKCAEGHNPFGGSPIIRCSDGQWSNLTLQCEKRPCGNAGELLHGQFKYEGEAVLGDKAYAICEDGYTLKGPKYIVCESAGWSSELPTCEEGKVEVTCSPPKVPNLEKKQGAREYRLRDVVTIRCSRGFQVSGENRITCGPDGQWQPPPPQCVPMPERNDKCGVPENSEGFNANLANKYVNQKSFASGARIYYVCDVGYSHAGGSKYRKCIKGQWSPLQLKCRRKLCGSAGELQNGHYVYTGVEFGDTATAVCDEGHQIVGRATRNCMSRGWDGHNPVCEAVMCDEPPEVANAEVISYGEAPYVYRTVLTYHCLVGSHVGHRDIWCTQNGTWSSPLLQCKDITCPSPNVPNASWVRSRTGRYQYRDSVYIHCYHPFSIVGPSTITCGEDGQWAPELPKCKQTARNAYRRGY